MHSLHVDEVLKKLDTSKNGLTGDEAEERLVKNGANRLVEPKKKGLIYKFFMQFKNVMVLVLLAAAVVTAAVAIYERNYSEFIDVGVILAIVLINAIIGLVQESKAEQALDALKKMTQPFAKVRRNGEIIKIETYKITIGDIVLLEAGDVVPADLRLIHTASLKIEESSLTGESVPSEKNASFECKEDAPLGDRFNMAFSSCIVSYGRGEGVVVATGMDTQMGRIAHMLTEGEEGETPLQKRLNKTGKFISIAVLFIAAIIFAISVVASVITDGGLEITDVLHAFMTAVAIAVAAIPEGLTAVITIIMAIGTQKMSKRNAIIKKMTAVETLGSTEIICSDKTGTLTLNKMTVTKTFVLGKEAEKELFNCMVLCNDTIVKKGSDNIVTIGDPTETALTNYVDKISNNVIDILEKYPRVDEKPFDSERKMMSTVNEYNGKRIVYSKGAPDLLLRKCSRILDNGEIRELTNDDKSRIEKENKSFAMDALRVLAFAIKEFDEGEPESDLIFVGLVGMIDPPRSEVKDAVAICKQAGITAVMITGDHRDTAYAIAKEIGIAADESQVTTGANIALMTDEELIEKVEDFRVYARVSPEHKVRIVRALQARGKTVAMTGDGVNDAPSLKVADIGVGMGITGTDVTKGAADMVLSDDNFATIVVAVKEGRKIFSNIQKTIQFLLSANIAEVVSLFVATLVFAFTSTKFVFLFPIQILWINLVTDSFPAIALGVEREEKGLMNKPPHKSNDNLFSGHVGRNIIYQGILQSMLVLGIYFTSKLVGWGNDVATTAAFISLCLIQLFHCFNVKSINDTIFSKELFKNRVMIIAFLVGLGLTLFVSFTPGVKEIFKVADLSIVQWITVVSFSIAIIPLVELSKLIIRKLEKV